MTICLQLDHVNYSYGAAKIRVLSDVNADFESGKMYAITGPSGAGKSTLLSLLATAPSRMNMGMLAMVTGISMVWPPS